MVYDIFLDTSEKKLALLIDPDKHSRDSLVEISRLAEKTKVHFIFVGGSLLHSDITETIFIIRECYSGPIILFPGHATQVSPEADAILFLSLISGRNPEFLIGNHVVAAPVIKQSNLEVIPTGYLLIECGKTTSVEYMSNTRPIPNNKPDIAIATALAGEMLGLKVLYIEGGSGAQEHVSTDIISGIASNCSIPIIVGGGIRNIQTLETILDAGANIVVVGTAIEQHPELLAEMMKALQD